MIKDSIILILVDNKFAIVIANVKKNCRIEMWSDTR